ncbi:MAG: sugar ABC transporter substrate-binding protein [Nanoarchaeota archaeon]|nr:sugar ABC transporter substrate-binding protein [Nanoarchaeota archaeon]
MASKGKKINMNYVWAIVAVIVVIVIIVAIAEFYHPSTYVPPSVPVTTPPVTTPPVTTPSSVVGYAFEFPNYSISVPVTITVSESFAAGGETKAFDADLAAFEKAYPNINVIVENSSFASSNIPTYAKAGDAPDVVYDSGDSASAWFTGGILLNLSKYINVVPIYSNQPSQLYSDQFLPVAVRDFEYNGLYGVPINYNYIVVFYNKKFFPNGFPNTTASLIPTLQSIKKTYGITPVAYSTPSEYGYRFAAWFTGFGGQVFNSQGIPQLNSTAMANALTFWNNMTNVWGLNVPGLTSPGQEQSLFEANKTAMIFDGPWDLSTYVSALGSNLGAAPLPMVSSTGDYASPFVGSNGWVITSPQASGASQTQIEAALIFVNFMTNNQSEFTFFNDAYDLPSRMTAYDAAMNELNSGKISPSYVDPVIEGILAQAKTGQPMPNLPQMAFYWNGFHEYASEYFTNHSISASAAAAGMENYMITNMKSSGEMP